MAFISKASAVSFAPRGVSLYNIHTGEWLRTVYWADGHYIREAVRDINWVLRDHVSNEVRPMNAGVLDVLGMLRDRLECHDPFLVVCGYRSAATNHMMYLRHNGVASNSYHIKGMAIDLRCRAARPVAGPGRGAEPAQRRRWLLSPVGFRPRRLRAGAHLVGAVRTPAEGSGGGGKQR